MNNFIYNKAIPALNKAGNNKYLIALRNAMAAILPLTIIGSIFSIITNFPVEAWTNFIAPYKAVLSIPNTVCLGIVGLVCAYSTAYQLSKELKINPYTTGIASVASFIITQIDAEGAISTANFGTTGLFLGLVVGIVTAKIVEFFYKKNIVIKMPESVPEMVSDSFSVLLPTGAVVVFFWLLTGVFSVDINGVLTMIFSPFVRGLNTLPGTLLVVFISLLLWCCGINESVISGLTYPVWYALLYENQAAFEAGEAVLNMGAYGWQYFGFWLGGTGGTIGLVLLMLRSKAKGYKTLGQLSAAPMLFQINEPVAFGFPIVMNPIMCIPYIAVPMITTALTWVAMSVGLIGKCVAMIPWTTPPILNGFLVTGGDWRAAVWQVGMIVLSVIIYYPFFKYEEKLQLAEDAKLLEEE